MSSTILFLCPHAAAKSVMAAAYFNRLAQQRGLPYQADAAGTEPGAIVSPKVAAMLGDEGIDVSQHMPRRITRPELESAHQIVSMGCALEDLEVAPERIEEWLDVPMVSQDMNGARAVIQAHVEELVSRLS